MACPGPCLRTKASWVLVIACVCLTICMQHIFVWGSMVVVASCDDSLVAAKPSPETLVLRKLLSENAEEPKTGGISLEPAPGRTGSTFQFMESKIKMPDSGMEIRRKFPRADSAIRQVHMPGTEIKMPYDDGPSRRETSTIDPRDSEEDLKPAESESVSERHNYGVGNPTNKYGEKHGEEDEGRKGNTEEDEKLDNVNEEKSDEQDGDEEEAKERKDSNDENVEEIDTHHQSEVREEFRKATDDIEARLEELRSSDTNTVGQTREDDDDDDYDILQELAEFPSKFRETAGRVADHLRPDVLKWTGTSKEYFDIANQQITESFSPLIGRQYAPFVAAMISYAILLLPLIVVILLFEHIKALFSLQKVILFANVYLTSYFATLWMASLVLGLDPMSFFFHNTLSSYISLQILQALGYGFYLLLQGSNVLYSFTLDKLLIVKLAAVAQWIVALSVGLHYYVTVFHPAITIKPPRTSWKSYAVYMIAFFVLCLFGKLREAKKQYTNTWNGNTTKKS